MKKLILIAIFAIFSTSSAISAELTPSVGISYNNSAFAAEGTEKNFDPDGNLKTVTQEYGAFAETFASVFVELGIGDLIAVGIDYVPGDIETPTNVSREGSGSSETGKMGPGNSSVSANFEDLTTVYAKLNIPFLGGSYIKGGFSQVDVVINENMASGSTYKDVDTDGYFAAVGYNHELTNGISVRAEVAAHQFDDVASDNGVAASAGTVANGGRNEVLVESMWGARGTISLVKSF